MRHKTRGIVLKSIKYSDTSVISHIYTEKFGMQSYIINGVRSVKSKNKMSLLQPLVLLDMVVYHRDGKNIQRIAELKPAYVFKDLPFNIAKSAIGVLIAEVLQKSIKEHEPNEDLFGFIMQAVILLDEKKEGFANFHLSFLLHLTRYLGFSPGGKLAEAGYFDLTEGKFSLQEPVHPYQIENPISRYFADILATPLVNAHTIALNRNQRNLLLEKILLYYSLHLEGFQKIVSPKILEDVFDAV